MCLLINCKGLSKCVFCDENRSGSVSNPLFDWVIDTNQSLHTDRDPSRWGVDQKETLRRRELFWELYTYDSWQVSGKGYANTECQVIAITVLDVRTPTVFLFVTY